MPHHNSNESEIQEGAAGLEAFMTSMVEAMAQTQAGLDKYYEQEGQNSSVRFAIPSVAIEVNLRIGLVSKSGNWVISVITGKPRTETSSELSGTVKLNMVAVPQSKPVP